MRSMTALFAAVTLALASRETVARAADTGRKGWKTYRSMGAGFQLRYPPRLRVQDAVKRKGAALAFALHDPSREPRGHAMGAWQDYDRVEFTVWEKGVQTPPADAGLMIEPGPLKVPGAPGLTGRSWRQTTLVGVQQWNARFEFGGRVVEVGSFQDDLALSILATLKPYRPEPE